MYTCLRGENVHVSVTNENSSAIVAAACHTGWLTHHGGSALHSWQMDKLALAIHDLTT